VSGMSDRAPCADRDLDQNRRRALLERLLVVARRVADPTDPLGASARARLLKATGLSPEGVELALTQHLETRPTEAEITSLLASASASASSPRCHVVIAANVCTGALRAIAVALATSSSVVVRPSSRDPVLAEIFARELAADPLFRAEGGSIELTTDLRPAPGDELHVYGSDQTVESLRVATDPGVIVRGHGAGIGIAVVGVRADARTAAQAIARDVIPFDQRGCLSPRIVLVEGSPTRAEDLCEALHEHLGQSPVPRGEIDRATMAEVAIYRASMQAVGRFWEGAGHAIGLDPEPRALILPPAARVVHSVPTSTDEVGSLLEPWVRYVAAVGLDDDSALSRAVLEKAHSARVSRLGLMQRPLFDGPVDRRRS
jgi:hypothetical protein